MFHKLVLLVILASLQPGKLQGEQPTPEEGSDAAIFDEIKTLLETIKSKTRTHIKEFRSFRDQVQDDLRSLKDDLTSLNDSVKGLNTTSLSMIQSFIATHDQEVNDKMDKVNSKLGVLNASFSQHREQTAAGLAQLQTFFTNTNFKLDTLNAITTQLSTGHKQIQTSISDMECMDTETGSNITKRLEAVQQCLECSLPPVHTCGGTGGWRRVVYLDMTDPSTTCPSGWQLTGYSKRTCGRVSTTEPSCDSVTFPVSGGEYSRVCGRIKAYQYSHTDAFEAYDDRQVTTIDGAYVAGVSLTHGTPREHIWTFAAGVSEALPNRDDACPCDAIITISVPPFVGNNYFCESGQNTGDRSGFFPDDPLWDGQNCTSSSTCCSFNTPPYFVKQLPTSTSNNIEARLCWLDSAYSAVELIELYVQ